MNEQKRKNSNRANILILVVIFVGVFLYNVINPGNSVEFQIDGEDIVLSGYEDVVYRFPLDSVESFTYVEEMEYPEGEKVICGTYSSEQWGEYILYAYRKVDSCIVAQTESGVYLFNFESNDTTQSLYEALLKLQES